MSDPGPVPSHWAVTTNGGSGKYNQFVEHVNDPSGHDVFEHGGWHHSRFDDLDRYDDLDHSGVDVDLQGPDHHWAAGPDFDAPGQN